MGDWDRNANWNRDVLERIVALLFALAGLADRAAGIHARRRREVLGILDCGEAAARAFIIGMATGAAVLGDETLPSGDANCRPDDPFCRAGDAFGAADAVVLAARLRVLALVLWFMPTATRQRALPCVANPQVDRRKHEGPATAHRNAAFPAPDTS